MAELRGLRHRLIARVHTVLNADVLAQSKSYFGDGTRIALELAECRESQDIDFICRDLTGYRALRDQGQTQSLGDLLRLPRAGLSLLRDVRADQYGIRTVFGVDGEAVKFETILEARMQVAAIKINQVPVRVLDRISCFAERWLANAYRWGDQAVLNRDAVDLAFMLSA